MATKSAKASPKKPTANASSKAVMDKVRKECRKHKVSPQQLANESGVWIGSCRKLLNGELVWIKDRTFSRWAAWLMGGDEPVSTVETPAKQLELPMPRRHIVDEDDIINELELEGLSDRISRLESKHSCSERGIEEIRREVHNLTQSINNLAMSIVSLQNDMLRVERRGSDF